MVQKRYSQIQNHVFFSFKFLPLGGHFSAASALLFPAWDPFWGSERLGSGLSTRLPRCACAGLCAHGPGLKGVSGWCNCSVFSHSVK